MKGKIIIFLSLSYLCLFLIDLIYVWQSTTNSMLMCGIFFRHICFNTETIYHTALLILVIIIPLGLYLISKEVEE